MPRLKHFAGLRGAPGWSQLSPKIAWILYDVASSGYLMMIPALGFSIYFRDIVVTDPGRADGLWGLAVAIPLAVAGISAPFLGAIFDRIPNRRLPLLALTAICCLFTSALWTVQPGDVFSAIAIFGIAQLAYILGFSLYESYLPQLVTREKIGCLSGTAWGLGFVGSVACLLLCLPLMKGGMGYENIERYKLVFPVAAVFFLVPGLYSVNRLRIEVRYIPAKRTFRDAYDNVISTLAGFRRQPTIARYLLGFYLLNDAIVTLVFFMAIFLKSNFGLSVSQLLWCVVLFHIVAIPATVIFGWLGDRIGLLVALNLTLCCWAVLILLMAFATHPYLPAVLSVLIGMGIGSSQALLRAIFGALIPREHSAQYFGFQTLAGRLSAIAGPLLFGAVSIFSGDQRLAVLSLLPFLAVGAWLINGLRKEIESALHPGTA